jgi:phage terminase large subunit-like protein
VSRARSVYSQCGRNVSPCRTQRASEAPPETEHERDALVATLRRVVIAVDPSGCAGEEDKRSDEIGIGHDGQAVRLGRRLSIFCNPAKTRTKIVIPTTENNGPPYR